MSHTVLVLGGYGTTGATLSELLLEHGDAEVSSPGGTARRAGPPPRRWTRGSPAG